VEVPIGLGLAAMIACNADERASSLAEGEHVVGEGIVG
jgi:hypothetical protein